MGGCLPSLHYVHWFGWWQAIYNRHILQPREKHLKNNGFDTRIKYALFSCPEGKENTREEAIKAADEIFQMDKSCDHLTSLHVLKIEDYYDLMADFCGCGIDDDTEFLTKQLDAVKKGCD